MKRKVVKIILIVVVVVALLATGGVYFINKAFEKIFIAQLSGMELSPIEDGSEDAVEDDTVKQPAAKAAGSSQDSAAGKSGPKSSGGSDSKNPSGSSNAAGQGAKKNIVSSKKLSEVQSKVSLSDKAKVLRVVLSKLSASDISALRAMAGGGVTGSEMENAKNILRQKLSPEDKEVIKQMYGKYAKYLD